jgi:hypothetical protein
MEREEENGVAALLIPIRPWSAMLRNICSSDGVRFPPRSCSSPEWPAAKGKKASRVASAMSDTTASVMSSVLHSVILPTRCPCCSPSTPFNTIITLSLFARVQLLFSPCMQPGEKRVRSFTAGSSSGSPLLTARNRIVAKPRSILHCTCPRQPRCLQDHVRPARLCQQRTAKTGSA